MWDLRYRPLQFADVLGQDGAVQVLKARLLKGNGLESSYVFSGGWGQGKTTLARILARALLCTDLQNQEPCNKCDSCTSIFNETNPGVVELDAASCGTVDVAKRIVEDLPFLVQGVSKRIYIFDEAHRMSRDAQDTLLKALEENRFVGIFCTTEADKLRAAVKSRSEIYPIRRVTREEIMVRMRYVLQQEKVQFEEDAVLAVIDHSHGHIRDILKKLEMLAQIGDITQESVRSYLNLSAVSVFYDILMSLGNPSVSVRLAEELCDRITPEEVSTGLAEAAMNSFRVGANLHIDFSQVDKAKALQVHELYGATTPSLAAYFLEDYKPTRVSLVCNLVRCASGVPSPKASTTAPPVMVQAPLTVTPSEAPVVAPASAPISAPIPVVGPVHAPEPPTPKPVALTHSTTVAAVGQLTELDDKAIPPKLPRGARDVAKLKVVKKTHDVKTLTPAEWQVMFKSAMAGAQG